MTDRSVASGTLIMFGRPGRDMLAARMKHLGSLPERVVVIDPQAEAILPEQQQVERIPVMASQADGEAELSLYSVAGLRSFTPPAPALTALFPRLRVDERLPVQLMSVDRLLKRLGELSGPLRLWVDMPGQESDLLQWLQDAGVLENAEEVVVRCGVESFFEQAGDSAAVQAWLKQQAFDLSELDETDPDWPDMYFKRNVLAHQLSESRKRVASLDGELEQAKAELEVRAQENAALTQENAALTQESAELRDQVAKLQDDLEAADETRKALEARAQEGAELRDQVAQFLDALKASGARKDKGAQDKGAIDFSQEAKDLQEYIAKLETAHKATQEKAEVALADLSLQIRLKEMQKLDLDNLRQRFEESEQRRRQQEELLMQLTPRLSQASEQLRQLQLAAETPYALAEEEETATTPARHAAKPKKSAARKSPAKTASKRSKKG